LKIDKNYNIVWNTLNLAEFSYLLTFIHKANVHDSCSMVNSIHNFVMDLIVV